jgi:hypothetical protein
MRCLHRFHSQIASSRSQIISGLTILNRRQFRQDYLAARRVSLPPIWIQVWRFAEADLIRYFTLSRSDLDLVRRQRGDQNRIGFALQLCALRYMGFCPDDLEIVPTTALAFVADQLQASPAALHVYGARSQTRTEHLQQIQLRLGFRDATREDFRSLADWLLARALEHDKPSLLFQLACEHLHAEKIIRPGVTRIG